MMHILFLLYTEDVEKTLSGFGECHADILILHITYCFSSLTHSVTHSPDICDLSHAAQIAAQSVEFPIELYAQKYSGKAFWPNCRLPPVGYVAFYCVRLSAKHQTCLEI
jgi:hypothetical protein